MSRVRRDHPEALGSLIGALRVKNRQRRTSLNRPSPAAVHVRNDLAPNLALVQRAPGDLTAPARAVRKCDAAQVQRVAEAIRAHGFCDPVLIDAQSRILDGVIRVEAAKLLGLRAIPCIVADHLSPMEQRTLRLSLNRLQERGSWDLEEPQARVRGASHWRMARSRSPASRNARSTRSSWTRSPTPSSPVR
ncbi:ParB N-terminal domain-containing protein [Methylobacterium sp. P31]